MQPRLSNDIHDRQQSRVESYLTVAEQSEQDRQPERSNLDNAETRTRV